MTECPEMEAWLLKKWLDLGNQRTTEFLRGGGHGEGEISPWPKGGLDGSVGGSFQCVSLLGQWHASCLIAFRGQWGPDSSVRQNMGALSGQEMASELTVMDVEASPLLSC